MQVYRLRQHYAYLFFIYLFIVVKPHIRRVHTIYTYIKMEIKEEDRIYKVCNNNQIENEYHRV